MKNNDNYNRVIMDFDEFKEEIKDVDANSTWIPEINSSVLTLKSFEEIESPEIAQECNVSLESAIDTSNNTGFVLKYGKNSYLVRDTALDSVLETAKIKGAALTRMPQYLFAEVLNKCFTVAKGDSLLLLRGEKVCACLSDLYEIMPISKLVDITEKALNDKFGNLKFVSAENNYTYTSALWELPEAQDDLLEAYDKCVQKHTKRLHGKNFMPAIRFISSDVGKYAATAIPLFKMNGTYFRINSGIKVAHKLGTGNKVGIENYEKEIDTIFSKFIDMEKTMGAMSNCYIEHPVNAMIGFCKKAGIGKRIATDAVEEIERFSNGSGCYMDDIYLSIAGVMSAAQQKGMSSMQLLDLEENIAKILYYKWKDFDVAGTITW